MVVPRNLNDSTAATVLSMMVVVTSPDSQLLNLCLYADSSPGLDETDDRSVICKFQELDRGVFRGAVICVERGKQWGENAALRSSSADGVGVGCQVLMVFGPGVLQYSKRLCEGQYDYLQRLPDSLLLHIMAHLELEDVRRLAQTCHRFKQQDPIGLSMICDAPETTTLPPPPIPTLRPTSTLFSPTALAACPAATPGLGALR
ncbi:hypothetical protein QTP70_007478 [Hemibagrus guttatus]|uniref:F-box domain-containing protein n=1 Tax=Hemibagrus guttatus TaxID=175788 RepID=A0AAE0UMX1_9TELE|nr:hypothetical protein QTP70_007478 [Hemibagrus guttatus]